MKKLSQLSLAALLIAGLAAPALHADTAPAAGSTPAAAPAKAKHAHKGGKHKHMKKAAAATPAATDKK